MLPRQITTVARWRTRLKAAVFVLLIVGIAVAAYLLLTTPTGAAIRHDPKQLAGQARHLAAVHPRATPAAVFGVYVAFGLLALPVWWLQLLAGASLGLWAGGGVCLAGSVASATAAAAVARWVAGEWVHASLESRVEKLRRVDDLLGSNGLLVVMTVRLVHVLPFGVCSYALGLTRVTPADVAVGTAIGNVPAVALYVGLGAGYAWRDWPFLIAVVGLNAVLLLPLAWRASHAKRAARRGFPVGGKSAGGSVQ